MCGALIASSVVESIPSLACSLRNCLLLSISFSLLFSFFSLFSRKPIRRMHLPMG